jgi:hypothetical protein
MPLPQDKAELERRIDDSRAALETLLDRYDEARLTGLRDAAGWSARDHLHHLAAWEEFQVARERDPGAYAIFGVPDKASYDALVAREPDFRAINEQIRQYGRELSLTEVRTYARRVRATAKGLLATFRDEDLRRPSNPADPASAPFMAIVAGNSYEHDDEHRGYIEAILERGM